MVKILCSTRRKVFLNAHSFAIREVIAWHLNMASIMVVMAGTNPETVNFRALITTQPAMENTTTWISTSKATKLW